MEGRKLDLPVGSVSGIYFRDRPVYRCAFTGACWRAKMQLVFVYANESYVHNKSNHEVPAVRHAFLLPTVLSSVLEGAQDFS